MIKEGAVIKDSVVKGPCVIGRNSQIVNAYIGPYTSVGNNCTIDGTEIEDSVIMDGSVILNAGGIVESLIGRNVKIVEANSKPKGCKICRR